LPFDGKKQIPRCASGWHGASWWLNRAAAWVLRKSEL
jgi:hypothetical protein